MIQLSSRPSRLAFAFGSLAGAVVLTSDARTARAEVVHLDPATGQPPATQTDARGLVVLAGPGAQNEAWSLAREVYADASLRPAVDEAHARVLAGEDAPPSAAPDLRDLADTRAAVHGDDPASKRLLASIAAQLHVRGIVYVEVGPPPNAPHARVFVTSTSAFDPATYTAAQTSSNPATGATPASAAAATNASDPSNVSNASDGGAPAASNIAWADTVRFLAKSYGPSAAAPATLAQAPQATGTVNATSSEPSGHHPFYASPWFWGAIGAAAFGGVALYFATKDSDSSSIHLQLQVPR